MKFVFGMLDLVFILAFIIKMSIANITKCCKKNGFITGATGIILGAYGSYAFMASLFNERVEAAATTQKPGGGVIVTKIGPKVKWSSVIFGAGKAVVRGGFAIIRVGGLSIALSATAYYLSRGSMAALMTSINSLKQDIANLPKDSSDFIRFNQKLETLAKEVKSITGPVGGISERSEEESLDISSEDVQKMLQDMIDEAKKYQPQKSEPPKDVPQTFFDFGGKSDVIIVPKQPEIEFEKQEIEESPVIGGNQIISEIIESSTGQSQVFTGMESQNEIIENRLNDLGLEVQALTSGANVTPIENKIQLRERYIANLNEMKESNQSLPEEIKSQCIVFFEEGNFNENIEFRSSVEQTAQISAFVTISQQLETRSLDDYNNFLKAGNRIMKGKLLWQKVESGAGKAIPLGGEYYELRYEGVAEDSINTAITTYAVGDITDTFGLLTDVNFSKHQMAPYRLAKFFTRYIMPVFRILSQFGTDSLFVELAVVMRAIRETVKGPKKKIGLFPDLSALRKLKTASDFANAGIIKLHLDLSTKTSKDFKYNKGMEKKLLIQQAKNRDFATTENSINVTKFIDRKGDDPIIEMFNSKVGIVRKTINNVYAYIDFIIIISEVYEGIHKQELEKLNFDDRYGKFDPAKDWERYFGN